MFVSAIPNLHGQKGSSIKYHLEIGVRDCLRIAQGSQVSFEADTNLVDDSREQLLERNDAKFMMGAMGA